MTSVKAEGGPAEIWRPIGVTSVVPRPRGSRMNNSARVVAIRTRPSGRTANPLLRAVPRIAVSCTSARCTRSCPLRRSTTSSMPPTARETVTASGCPFAPLVSATLPSSVSVIGPLASRTSGPPRTGRAAGPALVGLGSLEWAWLGSMTSSSRWSPTRPIPHPAGRPTSASRAKKSPHPHWEQMGRGGVPA